MIPFRGIDRLLMSGVLLGFDCIFDETKNLEAVATIYERFFDAYPNRYVDTTAVRPLSAKSRGLVRHRIGQGLRKAYEIKVFDADPSQGYDSYGLPRVGLMLNLRGNDPNEIDPPVWSSQSLYLPKQEEPEHILTWSVEVGRTMLVRYGVGGWCLAPSFGQGRSREEHKAARRAHPGLADWRIDYGIWRAKHGIRDTNWLTLITDDLLKKVGGVAGVRNKLSSRVVLHEVREGWLFQAGERPLVGGPGYEADDFSAYAEVARALAPCRDRVIGWFEETLRWMQRFDALPPSQPPVQEVRGSAQRGGRTEPPQELEVPRPLGEEALRSEAAFAQVWRDFVAKGDEAAIAHGIHPTFLESVHAALVAELADDPERLRKFQEELARAEQAPLPKPKKKKGAKKPP